MDNLPFLNREVILCLRSLTAAWAQEHKLFNLCCPQRASLFKEADEYGQHQLLHSRVDSESRFAIFLAIILWKMRLASHENISVSLTRREKCDILWTCESRNLRDCKKNYNSLWEINVGPKILARFSQASRVKISNDSHESRYEISVFKDSWVLLLNLSARLVRSESCYEISLCETHKKQYSLWNFVAKFASSNSRYEISVYETHKKQASLLILTRVSRENLARILGL
jgi:hypothetical protein